MYNRHTNGKYEKFIVTKIQLMIDHLLEIMNKTGEKNIQKLLGQCDNDFIISQKGYLKEFERILKQINDMSYCDPRIIENSKKYTNIIIYGAGGYGKIVAEQLTNKGIIYDGFAVSNKERKKENYLGKPVYSLDEIPFHKNNLLVIVAIKPTCWNEIVDMLNLNEIKTYLCPFLFEYSE